MFDDVLYDFRKFFCLPTNNFLNSFAYDLVFGFLPRRFSAGNYIYNEDDDAEELYLILKGVINVGFTIQGNKFSVEELSKDSVIGDYYVVKNRKSEFFFEAQNVIESIGIPKEHFLNVLNTHPKKKDLIIPKILSGYQKFREKMIKEQKRRLEGYNLINDYYDIVVKSKDLNNDMNELLFANEAKVETDIVISNRIDMILDKAVAFSKKLDKIINDFDKEFESFSDLMENNLS